VITETLAPLEPIQKTGKNGWERHVGSEEYWSTLRFLADSLDDAQRFRIMTENRIRSGELSDIDNPVLQLAVEAEKGIEKRLKLWFRQSGFRDYQMRNQGIGDKLLARLLGHLGDPLVASPAHWEEGTKAKRVLVRDEPFMRSVGQLWQFCGHWLRPA
jgi:hypothetical protein